MTERVRTIEDVEILRALVGPFPRAITRHIENPHLHLAIVKRAVWALRDFHSITSLFFSPSIYVEGYHPLAIMDRVEPTEACPLMDEYSARIPGDLTLDALMDRLNLLMAADVRELFRICSHRRTVFWSLAFKQHAIRYMSLDDPSPAFHLYAHMSQTSHGPASGSPIRFAPPLVGPHLQKLPGLRSRRIGRWRDTDIEHLSDTVFYVPTVSSDALFDTFFVDRDTSGAVVLWIVRMAVGPVPEGSMQGFRAVTDLIEKLEKEGRGRVAVKYLLVVPREVVQRSEATWDMVAEGLEVAPGEVFVQSLGA